MIEIDHSMIEIDHWVIEIDHRMIKVDLFYFFCGKGFDAKMSFGSAAKRLGGARCVP